MLRFLLIFLLIVTNSYALAAKVESSIAINQIGYASNYNKKALLINSSFPTKAVVLVNKETNIEVLKIKPSHPRYAQKEVVVQWLDFSRIAKSGRYFLRQGKVTSNTFVINKYPYEQLNNLALRTYYLQRCGVKVVDVSGLNHEACHLKDGVVVQDDAFNKSGTQLLSDGGWHDAGDFGKYIATASATVNRLLSLYESYPRLFTDTQLNIPESGNGVPDILDEVKVELYWMMTMQRDDGAVYRKLSGNQWPISGSPDLDNQLRYIYGVSSPETAKFSASLAFAARVYRQFDSNDSKRFLDAAEKSWRWLSKVSEQTVDEQPEDDSGSGRYLFSITDQEKSLETDMDDRISAAIELYLATNKKQYLDFIKENAKNAEYTLYEWKDISSLSLFHLLKQDKSVEFKELRIEVSKKLVAKAQKLLKKINENAYGLANTRFIWGSNKVVAEEGITLVNAYEITKKTEYLNAAYGQLDYLLGRNPMSISYVTGMGEHSVRFFNHLNARELEVVIPGFMVGGPNSKGQDNITPPNLGALSYIDNNHAYASNEYAIDYNSAIIGLSMSLMANVANYQQKVGN